MIRKITLSIILILLIVASYEVMFGESQFIRKNIPSVSELQSSSKEVETAVANLERVNNTDFETKKNSLNTAIEEYRQAKQQYENVVPTNLGTTTEVETAKDIYDIDFLWTIVGNYATEEGINLKFDVKKNTTSISSLNNTSSDYVVCDLQFVITGHYINLTDFIYDIEDDDRLNFEINDFAMVKVGKKDILENTADMVSDPDAYNSGKTSTGDENDLQVTLVVRDVKINASNLIESTGTIGNVVDSLTRTEEKQSVDATTTTGNTTTEENVKTN